MIRAIVLKADITGVMGKVEDLLDQSVAVDSVAEFVRLCEKASIAPSGIPHQQRLHRYLANPNIPHVYHEDGISPCFASYYYISVANTRYVLVVDGDSSARMGIARLMRSADYEVRDFDLAERLWGMTSGPDERIDEPEQTVLVGEVADQAALVGIMNALYNSGHTVVSVERLRPDADPHMDDTNEEA